MIITCINQKGGVGKTTTADTIASYLSHKGEKVLSIDLDPQGNLTTAFRAPMGEGIVESLRGNAPISKAIVSTDKGDLIPSSNFLRDAGEILTATGREFRLKKLLDEVKDNYAHIVIDTPPALDILTINALTATDKVVVVAQADVYSISGLSKLFEAISLVREFTNKDLAIDGILITRYNARTNVSKEIFETFQKIAKEIQTRVYTTPIREGIKIKEVQASQGNLFLDYPKEKVTEDYRLFIHELLGGEYGEEI